MSERLTQAEVEARMYYGGVKRAEIMMTRAEDAGRAYQNPYAKEVFATYVLPLAEAIKAEMNNTRPGRQRAHVELLRPLDPEAVALLSVRVVLSELLGASPSVGAKADGSVAHNTRHMGFSIGKAVQSELVLQQIEMHNPDLYHHLVNDLGRRLSKDERHRMTVMRMQAQKAGIQIVDWTLGAREQVGSYMLSLMEVFEIVEIGNLHTVRGRKEYRTVSMGRELLDRIEEIKEYVSTTMPVWGPCVAAPQDWLSPTGGGYHTDLMRRQHPVIVRGAPGVRNLVKRHQMPSVLAAANALQRTAWAVNERLLAAIKAVGEAFSTKEIVTGLDSPRPDQPDWMRDTPQDTWNESQAEEFVRWKRRMAEWYTHRKVMGTRFSRFNSTLRAAEMFSGYPEIYFVYFADSRGRLYPMTYGLNPQGSDMQKALLHAARGKPLDTPEAVKWFHVLGANKFGFDKAPVSDRQAWVVERQALILSFADDPVVNKGWRDADKPLQFLAWCFEYADWVRDTSGSFVSRLPVGMDGSCNGLQNLSALLRDPVGGMATNLVPSPVMRDVYADVAAAATQRALVADDPDGYIGDWLKHGINRTVCKRSVMTTPYGVTRRSATDYVVDDYLKEGKAPAEWDQKTYWRRANALMSVVWPAIGDVVVKGRECMQWLSQSAKTIVRAMDQDADDALIWWMSPSGFPASQAYFEVEEHRITTRLCGTTKIKIVTEADEPSVTRHASGLAPNFVHSMDASHLHFTAEACSAAGIDFLAMIHDDYGTLAADAEKLYRIIREQFVRLYEDNDPIQEFYERYPMIKAPPTKGTLDIRGVLGSTYFFL